ncbi:wax ester/triacylglycerol synthase domain-containing protein [Williamsia sp. MIQD14]|uniref:wax ester/triacylglycerol synthase domain-containing protein n=1 Tax=Williamsia sp. MIQD14 TaxID=3425703 RepID=UPI003DA0BF93
MTETTEVADVATDAAAGPTEYGPPDFTYLHMDTPARPMHWSMVLEIAGGDAPVGIDEIRDRVRSRVARYDVFGVGVRGGRWRRPDIVVTPADAIDIDHHVVATEVADAAARDRMIAELCATHLRRPDPFWHITLMTVAESGEQLLVLRVHHSLSDGLAGAAFAALLADGTPEQLAEFDRFGAGPRFRVGDVDPDVLADARAAHDEQWKAGRSGRGWPALTRSGRREIATVSVSTRDLRRAAKRHEATVHEFVLGAVGRTLSAHPPTATGPENIRVTLPATLDPTFRHTGNAVSVTLLNLAGDDTDLDRQIARSREQLSLIETRRAALALAATGHPSPPWPVMRAIVGASMSRMAPDIHIGVNPGFSRVRSVLGRRIVSLTPLSPLGGYSFSVTSLVLGDRTTFGIVTDPQALPGYAARFAAAFDELLTAP